MSLWTARRKRMKKVCCFRLETQMTDLQNILPGRVIWRRCPQSRLEFLASNEWLEAVDDASYGSLNAC